MWPTPARARTSRSLTAGTRSATSSLSSELKAETGSSGGGWTVAYEAGDKPTAGDFLSFGTAQPFVFAEVGQLSSTASSELSYDTLRDFFLPVTSTARQNATAQGFPLTGFKQIRDQVLTPGQGVHGVRETFDYTYHRRHHRHVR